MGCNCRGDYVRACWGLLRRYIKAVTRWEKAGKPTRTPAEIRRIFEEVCRNCEHFEPIEGKPWRGRCKVCGCYLGRHAHRLLRGNKIAMKTENCPLGKWEERTEKEP